MKKTRANEDTAKDDSGAVEQRGLNEGHAHVEKKRRHLKKVVIESDSGCDYENLLQSVADVPVDDECTKDYHPSNAGSEK